MGKRLKITRRVSWGVPEKLSVRPKDSSLIFCPQCYRTKLQFSSIKEAEDYMRWNSEEIQRENGKAPVRAYWCSSCCCVHITSKSRERDGQDQRKDTILEQLKLALTSDTISESRKYLRKAYDVLIESEGSAWIKEYAEKILMAVKEVDRREFDIVVKNTEYHLRIYDLSEAEKDLQWLENNNLNPDKTERLRDRLMDLLKI